MEGLQVFNHVVRLVFINFGAAIRVSLVPLIILWLMTWVLYTIIFVLILVIASSSSVNSDFLFFGMLLIAVPILLFVNCIFISWMAVAWHRFILAEDHPKGLSPPWDVSKMAPYLLRSFALSLIATASFTLVWFLGTSAYSTIYTFLSDEMVLVAGLAPLIFFVPIAWVMVRLSICLPGIALGKPLSWSDCWEETKPYASTIFTLVLCGAGTMAAILGVFVLTATIPVIGPVFIITGPIFFGWAFVMVCLSCLTTLYGVIIEKRALS